MLLDFPHIASFDAGTWIIQSVIFLAILWKIIKSPNLVEANGSMYPRAPYPTQKLYTLCNQIIFCFALCLKVQNNVADS